MSTGHIRVPAQFHQHHMALVDSTHAGHDGKNVEDAEAKKSEIE